MGTSRGFFKDALTRHAVFIQRLAAGEFKKVEKSLSKGQKEVIRRIKATKVSPDGTWTQRRLQSMLDDINEILTVVYAQAGSDVISGMVDFAQYESEFTGRMLSKGIGTVDFSAPDVQALNAAIKNEPMDVRPGKKGPTIGQSLRFYSKKKKQEITRLITQGILLGDSTDKITREISRVMRGKQVRQAEALVRTITNHVANKAREAVYNANRDVIGEEQWVSTLDGRTSHICRSLDGERFPIGKGPYPPAHYNCRSQRIPVPKDEYNLLTDLPSKRSARNPTTKKSELVSGNTTYNSWLKKQPKKFKEEVLGKSRAKLFDEGGLSMDRFVDKNFQQISLDKLKKLEPLAFEKAGL